MIIKSIFLLILTIYLKNSLKEELISITLFIEYKSIHIETNFNEIELTQCLVLV